MKAPLDCSTGTHRRSFTLTELLVVLGVISLVFVVAGAALSGVVQAANVSTTATLISDALTEGHTGAVAQNLPVEVRFYTLPASIGPTPAYNALQLHWLNPDGTTPPIHAPVNLPSGVVIDATPIHSSLIGANTNAATPDPTDSRLTPATRVFRFLPDGSTDLNPATNWFVTVRAATASDPANFPANWASLRVDPATGRVQIYRP